VTSFVGLALALVLGSSLAGPAERFIRASDLYRAEDFAGAAAELEALRAEGFASGPLEYNLGNAEYRQGRLGKAIAAYLRAADFMPREADLDFNLRVVRARRADAAPAGGAPTFLRSLLFPHTLLTIGEETALAATLWIAGLALLHAALFVRRAALRRAGAALVALAVLTAGSIAWRVAERSSRPPGVVVAETADVRTGPGGEYPVYFTLHDGYELRVLERSQGWTKVEVEGDKRGWVEDDRVVALPPLFG